MNTKSNYSGKHHHSHNLPVVDPEAQDAVAKDALLASNVAAPFDLRGRTKANSNGDRKHKSGFKSEHIEALKDHGDLIAAALAKVEADAAAGVIVENTPSIVVDYAYPDAIVEDTPSGVVI
jgi:hypothetical protein